MSVIMDVGNKDKRFRQTRFSFDGRLETIGETTEPFDFEESVPETSVGLYGLEYWKLTEDGNWPEGCW